jgi:hypothetical protein
MSGCKEKLKAMVDSKNLHPTFYSGESCTGTAYMHNSSEEGEFLDLGNVSIGRGGAFSLIIPPTYTATAYSFVNEASYEYDHASISSFVEKSADKLVYFTKLPTAATNQGGTILVNLQLADAFDLVETNDTEDLTSFSCAGFASVEMDGYHPPTDSVENPTCQKFMESYCARPEKANKTVCKCLLSNGQARSEYPGSKYPVDPINDGCNNENCHKSFISGVYQSQEILREQTSGCDCDSVFSKIKSTLRLNNVANFACDGTLIQVEGVSLVGNPNNEQIKEPWAIALIVLAVIIVISTLLYSIRAYGHTHAMNKDAFAEMKSNRFRISK